MLEFNNIHKHYQMGENIIRALNGVSLTIEDGDFVAIMGPSGSGKSTLMHVIGLLDVPDQGSYKINHKEVAHLTEDDLAVLRREEIGFIFQQFNLLPRMSALENVALPLLYSTQEEDFKFALKLLEKVGLGSRADHKPNELSGGQQQRVAIARSLINKPFVILADEPTGNLDSTSEKEIMNILRELNESGITVVIVTHEDEIGRQANRIIRMRDGEIQSDERLRDFKRVDNKLSHIRPRKPWIVSLLQHFKQGIATLAANKVRTGLSMLGIMIGVAAVVAMLALGRGAQKSIEKDLASLGSNLLMLRPGAMRGPGGAMGQAGATARLTSEDAKAIKEEIPNVRYSAPLIQNRGQLTWSNKNWNTTVIGGEPTYALIHSSVPKIGRFFSEEENRTRARVAVVGMTIVREVFSGKNPIGEYLKINKISFLVIGVLPEKGAGGFRDQDDTVLIPVLTAMHRVFGKEYVDSIDVEVMEAKYADEVQEKVLSLMNLRHRVPLSKQEESFSIFNTAEIQAALTSSMKTMTLLLSVIAAISLVVGGIGIMNIMLVSVTERTKEIGLRKAIGAKRSDILSQFLIEAVVVSLIGGSLGILLAWLITVVLSIVSGWATSISLSSILLAVTFSATVGIVFGIYPARKASNLAPIDALRYE